MTEAAIKKEIMAYLVKLPRACFMTRLSGTYRGLSGGRTINAGSDGAADIIGAYLGVPIAIETKGKLGPRGGAKGATQRASQIQWQIMWETAGGLYILARCLEDVTSQILKLWQGQELP